MDIFDLFAKITLDKSEYEKGLNDAEQKTSSFGNKLKTGLGTAAKVAAGATAAAVGAAATAVGFLTKKSIDAYAEYEQLTGGVETLFKNSADQVMEYANNAYKTAGLSANQYMETVTSFSASLLQSLDGDTAKAAEKADLAITDMSDNANKMGTSMESIQNAYQGFAKQNYTMLDNLKLGYGGTKEEMERLLKDAEKISGQKFDLSSYADVVDAIHVIQDEMGITGTTAEEATTTISGSFGLLKGAWQNLVTGFADGNADLDKLIGNLVDSLVGYTDDAGKHVNGFLDNIIPAVERALVGIGDGLERIVPVISEKLPELVEQVLPSLLNAATSLVSGLIAALPSILMVLIQQIPTIISGITQAIIQTGPAFIDAGRQLINYFANGLKGVNIEEKFFEILDKGLNFIDANLDDWLDKGIEIIVNLGNGFIKAIPKAIVFIGKVFTKLIDFILKQAPKILLKGTELIIKLAQGFIKAIPNIVATTTKVIAGLINTIIKNLPKIIETGFKIVAKLAVGLVKALPDIIKAVMSLSNSIRDTLSQVDWLSLGKNVVRGIIDGLKAMGTELLNAAKGIGSTILNGVKNFLGIKSPSRVMRDQVGVMIARGVIEGVNSQKNATKKSAEDLGKIYITAAKKTLQERKANNQISLAQEVDYWSEILKVCKAGTTAYQQASTELGKAKNNVNKQANKIFTSYKKDLKSLYKSYRDETKSLTKELKKQKKEIKENLKATVDALEKTYVDTVANRKKDIMSQLGLFSAFKADDAISKSDLQNNLRSQVDALKKWDASLDKLQNRIGSGALVDELQNMGVSSLNTLEELNKMSDTELNEYIKLYDEKNRLAEERAIQESEDLRAETDKQIAEAQEDAQTKLDKLDSSYEKSMKKLKVQFNKINASLKKSLEKDFKSIGINMAKGMDQGLSEAMKTTRKNIISEAKEIVKAFKKAFKIKSPSALFADEIGRMLPLGIEKGFKDAMPDAKRGIIETLDNMTNDIYDDDIWEPIERVSGGESNVSAPTNITMNIYGAEGQNINELANIISRKLGQETRRTQVVWA